MTYKTYKIKGSWTFKNKIASELYLTEEGDSSTVLIPFISNSKQYIGFCFMYGPVHYMDYMYGLNGIDEDFVYGEYTELPATEDNWPNGTNYKTIDFGSEYQEISYSFYRFITESANAVTGRIEKPAEEGEDSSDQVEDPSCIVVNVTSPDGVTLATEKTIVNSNIKVTIDESLLGGGVSGTPISVDNMSLATEVGKIYLYTGVTNEYYTNGCLYIVEEN